MEIMCPVEDRLSRLQCEQLVHTADGDGTEVNTVNNASSTTSRRSIRPVDLGMTGVRFQKDTVYRGPYVRQTGCSIGEIHLIMCHSFCTTCG